MRAMATSVKDYTTLYEILDIPAEATKVEIETANTKLKILF